MVLLAFATLNHCPLVKKGVTLSEQFTAAADAGFTYVSPDIFSLRAWRETGQTYSQLGDALNASGLECYDIAGLNISGSDDATQAEADEMLPFSIALGIEWMEARVTVPVDDGVRDRFARICEQYGAKGIGVAIEYSPYTPLDWMGDATALAHHGRNFAQTGIIIDTWHFFHGRDDWTDIDALDLADFAFVQFSDGVPVAESGGAGYGAELPDTMDLRSVPGEGSLDLQAFADALRGKGWNGVVSLEVLSAADRELPVDEFARRCYDATLPYWQ